jgi:hypothetical protein
MTAAFGSGEPALLRCTMAKGHRLIHAERTCLSIDPQPSLRAASSFEPRPLYIRSPIIVLCNHLCSAIIHNLKPTRLERSVELPPFRNAGRQLPHSKTAGAAIGCTRHSEEHVARSEFRPWLGRRVPARFSVLPDIAGHS